MVEVKVEERQRSGVYKHPKITKSKKITEQIRKLRYAAVMNVPIALYEYLYLHLCIYSYLY